MTSRWVCVHGHYYQPPRENPWLDVVERQPSAHPFPDWNARITAECYRPNAAARIVDGRGQIIGIVDNYQRTSWNFGPTLLTWLERNAPDVHAALRGADAASAQRFGGHGSAIAQAHGHLIMPLASPRDQRTQVRWGLADFRHRFGRDAEGMWLPECGVDTASLEALAAEGVGFTILAPHQAARVRPPGGGWQDVGSVEPGRCYRCPLPSGRSIDLFFYDGPLARAVAFERLLVDGGRFAARLADGAASRAAQQGHADPVLRHIATDGETYGHHHRYGDMALAWALDSIDRGNIAGARLTNYGEFRAAQPPTWEVAIRDATSWSCAHGVERWRADCGCNGGAGVGWNQAWRRPLREALDWLRDRTAELTEHHGAALFGDPWAARDAYIDVLLAGADRAARDRFVVTHAPSAKSAADRVRALQLMELSRHAMAMFTSCGWFFDDLGGIETVQILQYAARVCELGEAIGGAPLEAGFVDRLAAARSNLADSGDGRAIWKRWVAPARVDLAKVVANHAAVVAVTGEEPRPVDGHEVDVHDLTRRRTGRASLAMGAARCASSATGAASELAFAVIHLGDHQLLGGVAPYPGAAAWARRVDELGAAFASADLVAVQRAIDRDFAGATFSLRTLIGRDRDAVLATVLAATERGAEATYAALYDEHAPLIRYLVANELPVPPPLALTADHVLRERLRTALDAPRPSITVVRATIAEASQVKATLDTTEIAYAAGQALHRAIAQLAIDGHDPQSLEHLARLAEIAVRMKSPVDLWDAQNAAWQIRERELPSWRQQRDPDSARRVAAFVRLTTAIKVRVG